MIDIKMIINVNPHAIRIMIYIIAKYMWEHKRIVHIKQGWSQKLYMYVNVLIIMAINHTKQNMNHLKIKIIQS